MMVVLPGTILPAERWPDESAAAYAGGDMEPTTTVPGLARSLDAVLGRLQRGAGDPTLRRTPGGWWQALTTPEGPALVHLWGAGEDVHADARGDGARWALERVPTLVGAHDRPEEFASDHPVLAPLLRRRDVRLGATGLLDQTLPSAILEQKVTGAEAFTAIRRLSRRFGSVAPGSADERHPAQRMVCGPDAATWARIPTWEFLQAGADERRALVVHRAMARVDAFERLLERHARAGTTERGEALERGLRTIPGIGAWTAAVVRQHVLGDPDAWTIGDYHVPGMISLHLGGDAAEALEPFRPHRFRAEIALGALGLPERHGPRRTLPTHLPVRGGWARHGRG